MAEYNADLISLFIKDMQLYVAPKDFTLPNDADLHPWDASAHGNGQDSVPRRPIAAAVQSLDLTPTPPTLRNQYKQIFNRLKMTSVDFSTRRDVLRDIYRELSENPGGRTTDDLLEELCLRYEDQGMIRSKTTLRQIWQMGFRQRAFDYNGQIASVHVPVRLAEEIDSEAAFVQRAESGFVYAVINAGLEIDRAELAAILLNDREQEDYIKACWTTWRSAARSSTPKGATACPATAPSPSSTNRRWSFSATTSKTSKCRTTCRAQPKKPARWRRLPCCSARRTSQPRRAAICLPAAYSGT